MKWLLVTILLLASPTFAFEDKHEYVIRPDDMTSIIDYYIKAEFMLAFPYNVPFNPEQRCQAFAKRKGLEPKDATFVAFFYNPKLELQIVGCAFAKGIPPSSAKIWCSFLKKYPYLYQTKMGNKPKVVCSTGKSERL